MLKETAVIIPHYNGKDILVDCLNSLRLNNQDLFQIYLVDNNSTDDSVEYVRLKYPECIIFTMEKNLGYSGACNYAFHHTKEPFVLFLNNDTIHNSDFIAELLKFIKTEINCAAIQPKILSYYKRDQFDYSGAAGGELDLLAYPFCRGRIFDSIEIDKGQYDNPKNSTIFWASGTAMMIRRDCIDESGVFDDDFFAHMEEIDLSWRLHNRGLLIKVLSSAVIYHHSGYTLSAMNSRKMYLNHRNNLLMMLKNLKTYQLFSIFPLRLFMDYVQLCQSIIKFDFKRVLAILKAHYHVLFNFKRALKKRKMAKKLNLTIPIYPRSIVFDYYLKSKKKYSDLTIL